MTKQMIKQRRRFVQSSVMRTMPEEATPPVQQMTSEIIMSRSQRYGMALYSDACMDATPEGDAYRRAWFRAFKISAEMTVHSAVVGGPEAAGGERLFGTDRGHFLFEGLEQSGVVPRRPLDR